MDEFGRRSAIVVPISLPATLEAIRLDHVDNARLGVPAHVTLLFPFVPAPRLGDDDVATAMTAVRGTPAFDVDFRQVRTFDPLPPDEGAVWLAPEPAGPFIEMTEGLAASFPGYPPYGGIHDTIIPHLTLANVDVDVPALEAAARSELPFRRRVEAAVLLIEDDAGRWRIAQELSLG